ncbi:hypothetical protein ACFL0P_00405 [Candidatus Omnitrophota bacterium]
MSKIAEKILELDIDIAVINESPDPIGGSLKTKQIFKERNRL